MALKDWRPTLFSQGRKNRIALLGAIAALSLAFAGCASTPAATPASTPGGDTSAEAQEPIDIVAGVAPSSSPVALLMGIEQGFFEEEGLNVTTTPAATGAAGVTQLINGQTQVALGGLSATITAVSGGIPVLFVSGGVADHDDEKGTQYQTIVAGDSDIESFADLEGKNVAVNSLKCCWELWMREAVEKDGGDQSKVNFVQLPFPDAVTALRSGDVDAISTLQPFATNLRNEGFRDIGDSAAIAFDNPEASNTMYFMSKQFVDANPTVVERWRAALQKSADYANSHPEETLAAIAKQTQTDPTNLADVPLPMYVAEVDRDAVEAEAGFLVKYGVIEKAPSIDELVAP
jgi:NitT/TauT family transport system substrate-binding protein